MSTNGNQNKSTEINQRPIIQVVEAPKNTGTRKLFIALIVGVCLALTGYALSVNNFTDYDPPDYLYLHWGDYVHSTGGNDNVSSNNAPTDNPRLTAQYPYRALFYGRNGTNVTDEKMFVVYSKKPVTDLFTFQYVGDWSGSSTQYVRAFIEKEKINKYNPSGDPDNNSDILIMGPFANGLSTSKPIILGAQQFTNFTVAVAGYGTQGTKAYFSFDFYYDCASEHQQGASDLKINGLSSVSSVPYGYVIHCKNHTGGHTGGVGDSSGGSSGGSGDSNSSSGLSGDKNTGGDGGRHGWGDGSYGGGVKDSDVNSIDDGGGYSSRSDMEFSAPDDWRDQWEDDYTSMPQSEYKPDFPPYIPAEGDTGQTGADWDLPQWGDNDGVSGEINGYKTVEPQGEQSLIDFMSPMEEWLK